MGSRRPLPALTKVPRPDVAEQVVLSLAAEPLQKIPGPAALPIPRDDEKISAVYEPLIALGHALVIDRDRFVSGIHEPECMMPLEEFTHGEREIV